MTDKNDLAGVEINGQFKQALERMENNENPLFITGKAGTGKSTLLRYFRLHTQQQVAVVAPTGVAALNVGGQTIHSFFGFAPSVTPMEVRREKPSTKLKKILKKVDVLVIDEISMVRADLMDCIDESCRHCLDDDRPFGGKRVVFFGDLYQLPPVVSREEEQELFSQIYKSPYFFDAKVWHFARIDIIELEKIYRQRDGEFIDMLNQIRHNTIDATGMKKLNQSYQPESFDSDEGYITLTTTNKAANEMNLRKLSQLGGEEKSYSGKIEGSFGERTLPTEESLQLKAGAQVMLLNNDVMGRWVNGSMGVIEEIAEVKDGEDKILVRLQEGDLVEVEPFTWSINRYYFDQATQSLETEPVGSFTQYPLRLAWAVTIHKSQGKTFDKVVLDVGWGTFSPGQTYVAISRCTSLDGLVLKRPVARKHIWTDERIVVFMEGRNETESEEINQPKIMTKGQKVSRIHQAMLSKQPLKMMVLSPTNLEEHLEIRPTNLREKTELGKAYLMMDGMTETGQKQIRLDRIVSIE